MLKPSLAFSIGFVSILRPFVKANTEIVNFDATPEPGTLIPWTSKWYDIDSIIKSHRRLCVGQYLAQK